MNDLQKLRADLVEQIANGDPCLDFRRDGETQRIAEANKLIDAYLKGIADHLISLRDEASDSEMNLCFKSGYMMGVAVAHYVVREQEV